MRWVVGIELFPKIAMGWGAVRELNTDHGLELGRWGRRQ